MTWLKARHVDQLYTKELVCASFDCALTLEFSLSIYMLNPTIFDSQWPLICNPIFNSLQFITDLGMIHPSDMERGLSNGAMEVRIISELQHAKTIKPLLLFDCIGLKILLSHLLCLLCLFICLRIIRVGHNGLDAEKCAQGLCE